MIGMMTMMVVMPFWGCYRTDNPLLVRRKVVVVVVMMMVMVTRLAALFSLRTDSRRWLWPQGKT